MTNNRAAIIFAAILLPGAVAKAETVAIVHAKAWTLTADAPLDDATIVLTDGRVVSATAAGPAPAGARIVDANGKTVTPGLMHAATQIGLVEVHAASETVDYSAKKDAPGAGFDVQYAINPNSALIRLARADGLTRAVSYPGDSGTPPFAGMGVLLRLVESGEVLERAQVGVFASIGIQSATSTVGSRAAQWQMLRIALDTAKAGPVEPAAATAAATAAAKPPPQTPDALALERVINRKLPLAILTNRESDIRQAVKLAHDYGIRVVIIGGAEAWRAAAELAAANIPVILNPMANLPMSFDEIGSRLDNAALLQKSGVVVAMSLGGVQGYNAGSSLREGAGIAVANGLPYIVGLRSITLAPAQIWGIDDHQGTIAPDKDGDLVIWDGDPLEPGTLPVAVFVQGKEVSLATHQSELRDRYFPLAGISKPSVAP